MDAKYGWVVSQFRELEPPYFFMDHGYELLTFRRIYLHPLGHYRISVARGRRVWQMILENDNYSLDDDPDKKEIIEGAYMDCSEYLSLDESWGEV